MEDEWEEESTLVVELSGVIDKDFLKKEQKQCHVLGIDTDRPLLQIGSYVFAGEYADSLGTCVLFEEKSSESVSKKTIQPLTTSEPVKLEYLCHTRKKLIMQRAFLNEKNAVQEQEEINHQMEAVRGEGETDDPSHLLGSSWPIGFDSTMDLTGAAESLGVVLPKQPRLDRYGDT